MELELYEDDEFKLTLGKEDFNVADVAFYIKDGKQRVRSCYPIPWKLIRDFAEETPRGLLEHKLEDLNPEMGSDLKKENLSFDSAHLAICLAYINRKR